jgi:hypothetical protein
VFFVFSFEQEIIFFYKDFFVVGAFTDQDVASQRCIGGQRLVGQAIDSLLHGQKITMAGRVDDDGFLGGTRASRQQYE